MITPVSKNPREERYTLNTDADADSTAILTLQFSNLKY